MNEAGEPFRCRLIEWRPEKRYTAQEIVDRLQLELAPAGRPKKEGKGSLRITRTAWVIDGDDVLTPKAVAESRSWPRSQAKGLYKTPLGSGKHDITCPWNHEHTDGLDTGAAYFEPDELFPWADFVASIRTEDKFHIRQLLEFLGVCSTRGAA